MIKRWIEVQIIKEGIHCWHGAKDQEDIKFLANDHFHYFFITTKIFVEHGNRAIEFIQFKRWLEANIGDINYKSCEMIAEQVIELVNKQYPGRDIVVKVAEDNLNGAIVEFTKE